LPIVDRGDAADGEWGRQVGGFQRVARTPADADADGREGRGVGLVVVEDGNRSTGPYVADIVDLNDVHHDTERRSA
jgi:hypothetical protein